MEELTLPKFPSSYRTLYHAPPADHRTGCNHRLYRRYRLHRIHVPKNIYAKPRRGIGGHLVGLVSGSLCALIPHSFTLASISVIEFAVGVSICLMVTIDVEHPPASGAALGVVLMGFTPGAMIVVLTSSTILSLAHIFSRNYQRI